MENTRRVSSRGPNGSAASVISATEIWSSPAGVCRRKSAIFHSARRAGWLDAASAGAPGRRLVDAQALSIDYGAVDRVEALIEPENDASRALAANRPVTPMTRNSQRPAFVLVADLPQKSGPYTEPPPVARPWAVFVFDRSSPHSRFASKSREPS